MAPDSMKLILLGRTFLIQKDIPLDDTVKLQLTEDKQSIRIWDERLNTFDVLIDLNGKVHANE